MTKEEMKNKYSAFITKISEILGLRKPIDIIKLCATTDLFFQPLEKRIAELEELHKGMSEAYNEERERTARLEKESQNRITKEN